MNPRRRDTRRPWALSALCLTAVVALAAPAAASASAKSRFYVGMLSADVNPYVPATPGRAAELAAMSRAGVSVVRTSFDASRPVASLDPLVLQAAQAHIRVLPMLLDWHGFVAGRGPQRGFHPPKPKAFAAYAAAVAQRYGPKGAFWSGPGAGLRKYAITGYQVWNEPNLPVFWRPKPNPKSYVKLLRSTSKALHRVDRHATIISAGIPDSTQSRPLDYKHYLAAFLAAGGGRYVNAIGVHGYADSVRRAKSVLRGYRRVLDRNHGKHLQMVITEVGWADGGAPNPMNVGSRMQARLIKSVFALVGRLRRPYKLGGIFYFEWKDYLGPTNGRGDTWGFHTGLFRGDGSPKPALKSFLRAVRKLI